MRAKRILLWASVVFFLALACQRQEPTVSKIVIPEESREVFSSGITLDAGGEDEESQQDQTLTVRFSATGDWSVSVSETRASSWLSVQPTSGGAGDVMLKLTIHPNSTFVDREVTIVISCGKDRNDFRVRQKGRVAVFIVSGPSEDLPAAGGRYSLRVTTNAAWTLSTDAAWLVPGVTSGSAGVADIVLTVAANSDAGKRRAVLTFSFAGKSFVHTMTQSGSHSVGSFTGIIEDWEDESAQFNKEK